MIEILRTFLSNLQYDEKLKLSILMLLLQNWRLSTSLGETNFFKLNQQQTFYHTNQASCTSRVLIAHNI